ncbi:MAG TPA: BamA/TamA family outer membrane protein [Chitinophagales bacterium]|nr:BamA/TamA family outer membrane protein [Chitinophagales bacterium]
MYLLTYPTKVKHSLLIRFTLITLLSILTSSTVNSQEKIPSLSEINKQSSVKSLIKDISISGNKKTKDFVIIREMGFDIGDSLPVTNIATTLSRVKYNILNTKLFTDVNLNIRNWDAEGLEIAVTVVEKWYILPIPIFQLADRNLNEWWVDRNKDFKRIQYGAMINWGNFRGRNETLNISASLGFAQMIGLQYDMPHLFSKGRLGAHIDINMMRSKRMAIDTRNNKLVFYYDKNFITKSIHVAPRLLIHRDANTYHYVEAAYRYKWVDRHVPQLNEDYFLNGKNTQSAVSVEYGFDIDKRTLKAYPTVGFQIKGSISNYGLGLQNNINMTMLSLSGSKFFTLDKKSKHSTGHYLKVNSSFPRQQPYNLQRGLGFEQDFVRGYEYYVIDGQHYFLAKNEYRYHLGTLKIGANPKKRKPLLLQPLPFDFFIKAYIDAAYVSDKFYTFENTLHNELLVGGGIGLDILLMYDRVVRIEYSVNKEKEHGLFFHLELPF